MRIIFYGHFLISFKDANILYLDGVKGSLGMQIGLLSKKKSKEHEDLQLREGPNVMADIKKTQEEIDVLLEQEDLRWKQRAKQSWLHRGDRNTKLYHAWPNQRRKMNRIVQIMDESESNHKEPWEIGEAFIQFYQSLFSTSRSEGIEDCVSLVEAQVTEDMNGQLTKVFLVEEISIALITNTTTQSASTRWFCSMFLPKV